MIISVICHHCNATGTSLGFILLGKAQIWLILLRLLPAFIIEGSIRLQWEVGKNKDIFFSYPSL